jgi:hypothetical protein
MIFIKWLFNRKERKENLFKEQLQIKSKEKINIDTFNGNDTSKSAKEIAERAYILFIFHLVATSKLAASEAYDFLSRFNIFFELTKEEYNILNDSSSFINSIDSSKTENIYLLLWVLKRIEVLKEPSEACRVEEIIEVFFPNGSIVNPNRFVFENKFKRDFNEIINMHKFYCDYKNEKFGSSGLDNDNVHRIENRINALKWVLNMNTTLKENIKNNKHHEF